MRAAILIVLAGCFGEGPGPGTASGATVLFQLDLHPLQQDDCRSGSYIGGVAIGAQSAYAVTHTFLPACSGGSGNPDEKLPSSVFRFDKQNGSGRMKIGDAGVSQEGGGSRPRVGARDGEVIWTYADVGSNMLQIRSQSGAINGTLTQPQSVVASLVIDQSITFVASWNGPMNASNALGPRYPCCGFVNTNPSPHQLFTITNAAPVVASGLGVTPTFVIDQLKQPVVGNTSSLYWFQQMPSGSQLVEYPKSGGTTTVMVATMSPSAYPVGVAVDDTTIAYAIGVDYRMFGNGGDVPRQCYIDSTSVGMPRTERRLLGTEQFTCLDIALDGDDIYFTIVDAVDADGGLYLRNRGIGRVNITTLAFDSLELGIASVEAGPRQLYVDGDGLILVAPFAVARIPKSALDGKTEIEK